MNVFLIFCQLNSVRSCLDEMKAGGLARKAYPAQVLGLILSDVIGDSLEIIASGPTVINSQWPEDRRRAEAINVLRKYNVLEKVSVGEFRRSLRLA
ncbi:unnamed protein product [Protopolystoma xenopodis]|uniref:MOFRL-associated domain-containing protein n=1 Tax=Protopolystoma xenopodis TaxID=117903 RepID=A0A3S5CIG6_9PLAT|nr:unnamed protein product [Protopolystoma xenopodis]